MTNKFSEIDRNRKSTNKTNDYQTGPTDEAFFQSRLEQAEIVIALFPESDGTSGVAIKGIETPQEFQVLLQRLLRQVNKDLGDER